MPSPTSSSQLVVLVPVDFSPPSQRALAWAFDYARRAACDVHLLHVVERHWRLSELDADPEDVKRELTEIARESESELEMMVHSAAERAAIGEIHRHVASGKPANEILRIADELDADLIVMGTHGHTGVERALLGSVCEKVVRRAPCTVVAVKPTRS